MVVADAWIGVVHRFLIARFFKLRGGDREFGSFAIAVRLSAQLITARIVLDLETTSKILFELRAHRFSFLSVVYLQIAS